MTCDASQPPPYFSQFESPELFAAIVDGDVSANDDPLWARSGARTPEEYAFWAWRSCGVACIRSVIAERHGSAPTPMALARELLAAGGYVRRDNGLHGLIYQPSVDYLLEHWDIKARVRVDYAISDMLTDVAGGARVIASVHSSIRRAPTSPLGTGGHLVLAFATDGSAITFHNPGAHSPETRQNVRLSSKIFDRFYARRAIVVPCP